MRKVEPGHWVRCPEDRGQEAHEGKIVEVSQEVKTLPDGTEYLWVMVESHIQYHNHKASWPSHRLGLKVKEGGLYHG